MRIARFSRGSDISYALVDGEGDAAELVVISGDPIYTPVRATGERVGLNEDGVRLLAPVIPRSKIIGVGRNYPLHAAEHEQPVPSEPLLFLKPNTAVIGPDDPILLPSWSSQVEHEGELAVVIGKVTREVSPESALAHVFGYTCANDVTARDVQRAESQWARAKGFDSACPIGPWVVPDLDVEDLEITVNVGGQSRQHGRTSEMVFDIPYLISYISQAFTLLPGDIILTGTPAGVGPLVHRDVVEVTIESIGTLRNPVLSRD